MAFYETNDPDAPEVDISSWGDLIPTGGKLLRDSAVSSNTNLSSAFSDTVNSLFVMLSNDGNVNNSTYLRGLQLLYSFGLDPLVTAYWSDRGASIEGIEDPISGVASLETLSSMSAEFASIKSEIRKILLKTTIDSRLIEMAREEASGFGPMSDILEAILLYFIVLGESNIGRIRV